MRPEIPAHGRSVQAYMENQNVVKPCRTASTILHGEQDRRQQEWFKRDDSAPGS